jgi:type II secretory pathway pseudopilin PulG
MRRAAREDGMTIVEVLVAGMILVVGALGVLGIVDAAGHNTFRAEQSQAVANVMQREMEKLRGLSYEELALKELPVHESKAENPNSRIASTSYFYTGRNETGLKPLVYNDSFNGTEKIKGGKVTPGPTPFQVGQVRGEIYRYIVWDTCPAALCQDGRHLKRAVVIATIEKTAAGGTRRYQEIQGQIVDPEAEPSSFPSQEPGGSSETPWTLLLTDTPCSEPERKVPPKEKGDHPTHNTRGDCADGLQKGSTPGAPDLLWSSPPDEEPNYGYDYATDVEPEEGASKDEGLQILPGASCESSEATELAGGVATDPDPQPEAFKKVHRWLSPPLGGTEDLLLTGEGTLDLWTETLGGVSYSGRICAWLFVRSYSENGSVTDTFAVNLGPPVSVDFSHFEQSWPSKETEISLPLSFGYASEGGALPLHPGSRLGLALSVGKDSKSALQLLYDAPSFDSRIELTTAGAPPPG